MPASSNRFPAGPLRVAPIALLMLGGLVPSATTGMGASPAPATASSPPAQLPRDTLVIVPGRPPADFAIALEGGERRAVPGDYYVLAIRIDRAGRGTFRVEPSLPGSAVVSGTFDVPDSVVRQLHRASARLWVPRPTAPPPNPGSVNVADLVLTGYGQTVRIGDPLRPPWDRDARTLSRLIRRTVPDSLWARAGLRSS